MTEERDATLQALFDEAAPDLDGEDFTSAVVAQARFARPRRAAGWLAAAALVAVCAGLLLPLEGLAGLLAQGLTTSLFELGDSWWALVVSPINSVASVLVLGLKAARMGLARARSASYA